MFFIENPTGIGVIEIVKDEDVQTIVDVAKDLSGLPTMKLGRNKNQSERKILLMHMDTQANA